MKASLFRVVMLLTVLIVLGSIPNGVFVKAQEPTGTGDEVNRPASSLPPKAPGQVGGPGTTTWKWWTMAGSAFIPSSNSMTWNYGGAGCLEPISSGAWRASVNIPDGSILEYMYFGYWNDAASATSIAYLYRYYYTGSAVELLHLISNPGSTETGYHYVGSSISGTPTVDNLDNAYALVWGGSGGSSVHELCYIQVGYIPPSIFGTALPMIVR